MTERDHPEDICECGDFRKDHPLGRRCKFTPEDPLRGDGHFGVGACYRFKLATRTRDT